MNSVNMQHIFNVFGSRFIMGRNIENLVKIISNHNFPYYWQYSWVHNNFWHTGFKMLHCMRWSVQVYVMQCQFPVLNGFCFQDKPMPRVNRNTIYSIIIHGCTNMLDINMIIDSKHMNTFVISLPFTEGWQMQVGVACAEWISRWSSITQVSCPSNLNAEPSTPHFCIHTSQWVTSVGIWPWSMKSILFSLKQHSTCSGSSSGFCACQKWCQER